MGSRGRSIRLRIYYLVAIPLVTLLAVFAGVAYTSIRNVINLDRAPSLIRVTSVPLATFMTTLQAERRAAVVYTSAPTGENLSEYQKAMTATRQGVPALEAALNTPAAKATATPDETAAITSFLAAVTGGKLGELRTAVTGKALPAPTSPVSPDLVALRAYTDIIGGIPAVFQAEAKSMTEANAAVQGLGLISTVTAREELSIQDAVLAGALASGSLTPDARVVFVEAAGRAQMDEKVFQSTLSPVELNAFNNGYGARKGFSQLAPQRVQGQLTKITQGVEAGMPLSGLTAQGLSKLTWKYLTTTVAQANFSGGLATAEAELNADQLTADRARNMVIILGAGGALGLILTLIVTVTLARSVNRRLNRLRRSALALAQEHLPSVISRLRRGEQVDVAAEAPPLRVGNDEIGQVGRAFDAVRQTAIASAVEEARLRQGINDVFRNLARRNQSLLQRQLTSLDQMERRATDPEVLDDLFKLDHLTTRMRRHAEGLIILSGAPPGRGWSSPVRLVDVMRGAVSEVEDYARVQVATQAKAALSGSAVTDVIHLLAELIENATSLSPPYTQVRVTGEVVSNGFAIEVEDRGLGMTPDRIAELNQRLSSPPDVNPANTEQLGLFVVAHLARRHGISVTLRTSPYGGTTAIALIPRALIVDDRPAALPSGGDGTGRLGGSTPADAAALRPPGAPSGPGGSAPAGSGGYHGAGTADGNGRAYGEAPDLDSIPLGNYGAGARDAGGYARPAAPAGRGGYQGRRAAPHAARRGEVPVVTGVPVSRDIAPPFDPFSPMDHAANGGTAGGPGSGSLANGTGHGPGPTGPQPAYRPNQGAGYEKIDRNSMDYQGGGASDSDITGLPRRVRQANLAPQLRNPPAGGNSQSGVPQARATSLQDMRNTLSAMQRGWQHGRTQSQRDTEGDPDGA